MFPGGPAPFPGGLAPKGAAPKGLGKGKPTFMMSGGKGVNAFGPATFGGAPRGIMGFMPKGGFGGKGLAAGSGLPFAPQKPATPQETEKNKQILDTLLPCVAGAIDECGGVMKISDICELKEVKEQIAQIPNGFPKALPKILSQWADFFVSMPNGLVGTAMGYDTGMIREDGTLDPAFESTFTASAKPVPEQKTTTDVLKPGKKIDLSEAADELWRACINLEDDAGLYGAFQKVQASRAQIRGDSGLNISLDPSKIAQSLVGTAVDADFDKTVKLSESDILHRRQQILARCFEILKMAPGKSLMLSVLVGDTAIRELKKGAVSKFLHWMQEFPANFAVTPEADGSQYKVTLISDVMPPLTKPTSKKPRLQ